MNKTLHRLTILVFCLLLSYLSRAQYYLRGEIKSETNEPLQNVRILLHSNNLLYSSGESGGFGITTKALYDTLTLTIMGYEEKVIGVRTDQYQTITLKAQTVNTNLHKKKLSSFTKD